MIDPTTMTSREFNSDTAGAKRAAANGPVFITDRGEPSHVLMTYQDYVKLSIEKSTLYEALAGHGAEDASLELSVPKIESQVL